MGSHTTNNDLARGIALKLDGRYEDAINEFKKILTEDPNSIDGHYQLGLVYGFTGNFDESLEELRHAATLDPGRTDIRNDLALTYSMLGMYDEAKCEFEEVLRREPDNEKALKNIVFFTEPS
ncbi:MAG TPA: tetratricopeptide repeat protein [Chthonomonadaceae bacterium]|nr:tetratricopeptide repeat protein [Chthonomonadaceae bacterium]